MRLDALRTPALILNEKRLAANIALHATIDRHPGVILRPHFKTAKSMEVATRIFHLAKRATVSTLREAEYLCDNGVLDILYAVVRRPPRSFASLSSNAVRCAQPARARRTPHANATTDEHCNVPGPPGRSMLLVSTASAAPHAKRTISARATCLRSGASVAHYVAPSVCANRK